MNTILSSKFLTIYNELDALFRKKLNVDQNVSHTDLIWKLSKQDYLIKSNKYDLLSFARLRNAIVHNPNREDAHPIAEPHEYIIAQYEMIRDKLLNPTRAISLAILKENIYTTSLDEKVIEVMRTMSDKVYTHVPVIQNDKFVGVFSENVVFSYLVENEIASVDKDIQIREFKDFLPIEKHSSEIFKFLPRDTLFSDVQELYTKELKIKRRLGAVFITHNGKKDESILGMLTAWDIAAY